MRFRRRIEEDHPDINVIPLIDVLLVILIFLAASSTFMRYTHLPVHLPQANHLAQPEQALLIIAIDQDGHYALNDEWIANQEHDLLDSKLSEYAREHAQSQIFIMADEHAPHGAVVRLMDLARQHGIERFQFAAQQS